jgi:hypothetical protein
MEKKHGPAVPKASALARRLPSSSALWRLSERTQARWKNGKNGKVKLYVNV